MTEVTADYDYRSIHCCCYFSCFYLSFYHIGIMLESIPPEILSIVGYHLSIDSLQPPTSVLSSSKYLNECLSPRSNPNLYAKIYRDSFDTSAAVRRCTDDLTARRLTAELEHRTRALGRLKRRLRHGEVGEVEESDLWVIYILLIEHGMSFLISLTCKGTLMGRREEPLTPVH